VLARPRICTLIVLLQMCLLSTMSWAQEMVKPESLPQGFVLVVKDQSSKANKDNPIYFASSINGWNPADPEYLLTGRSDTRWQIVIDEDLQGVTVQFKFTQGGWDREELDAEGNAIPNRSLPMVDASKLAPGERPIIELDVVDFRVPMSLAEQVRMEGFYRELQVTGDVHRMQVQSGSGLSEALTRDLLIWTPPGYDDPANADTNYPVLYMFDGQNIFEQMPGVPGEWGADETAMKLVLSGEIEPLIIVAIPHGGTSRLEEYLPFGNYRGVVGRGAETMDWMLREVKPKIERAFRVKHGREHTAIGGASLGGAMAIYASTTHSSEFGMAIVESLPMMGDEGKAAEEYLASISQWPDKIFIGMGGNEVGDGAEAEERNIQYRKWAQRVHRMAGKAGVPERNRKLMIVSGATHNELAWADRFDNALRFMFGK
jgi:predicted alpha/beta superfamily hydrolase